MDCHTRGCQCPMAPGWKKHWHDEHEEWYYTHESGASSWDFPEPDGELEPVQEEPEQEEPEQDQPGQDQPAPPSGNGSLFGSTSLFEPTSTPSSLFATRTSAANPFANATPAANPFANATPAATPAANPFAAIGSAPTQAPAVAANPFAAIGAARSKPRSSRRAPRRIRSRRARRRP